MYGTLINLITYCDNKKNLLEIADLIKEPFWDLLPILNRLIEEFSKFPVSTKGENR